MTEVGQDVLDLDAVRMVAAFAARRLSPVEVMTEVLRRIDAVEPTLNALYVRHSTAALEAARASASRWLAGRPLGALDGVPVTVKENIATEGVPVPLGSAGTALVPAAADAPVAARLRAAGAIIVGKTVMPDFGMLSSGVSSLHPVARNPWNPRWSPGGSSAGAAVAAAAGYGPLHVGTDIGGSIRLPAGWSGIVGLKPSFGRVPVDPPYFGRVAGPMCRAADDAALLMSVLSGPHPGDHMSLPGQVIDWTAAGTSPRGLRIGLLADAGPGLPVDPQIAAAIRAAALLFESAGATVEPVQPFFTREMLDDLDLFWRVRGWADLRALPHAAQGAVLPFIADWCRGGADVPGTTVLRCINRMLEVSAVTLAATEPYDVVLSPVSPVPTFPAEWPMPSNDVRRPMEHIAFNVPFNMSGQPAASVNCGFTDDGRPIGLQISGRRFDDRGVLEMVRWYERSRPAAAVPHWPLPDSFLDAPEN